MTGKEAIEELKRQNEALLRMLDMIRELEGRVPGKILDDLIADVAKCTARGIKIDNQLSEFLDQAK